MKIPIKRAGVFFIPLLTLVFLYLTILYPDHRVYGIKTRNILLFIGMLLCLGKIFATFTERKSENFSWFRLFLPSLILFELILLFFGRISFLSAFIIIAVMEAVLVLGVLIFARKLIKKSEKTTTALRKVLSSLLPPIFASWLVFEMTLIYFTFRGFWGLFRTRKEEGWSYWRQSDFPLIFVLLVILAPIEFAVIHIIFGIESVVVQLIAVFLYIWGFLYIVGFWFSAKLSPHKINRRTISLNRGALGNAHFPVHLVKSLKIKQSRMFGEKAANDIFDLTIPGTPAVELTLKEAVKVDSIFDPSGRAVKRILVSIDEPSLFCQEIRKFCSMELNL